MNYISCQSFHTLTHWQSNEQDTVNTLNGTTTFCFGDENNLTGGLVSSLTTAYYNTFWNAAFKYNGEWGNADLYNSLEWYVPCEGNIFYAHEVKVIHNLNTNQYQLYGKFGSVTENDPDWLDKCQRTFWTDIITAEDERYIRNEWYHYWGPWNVRLNNSSQVSITYQDVYADLQLLADNDTGLIDTYQRQEMLGFALATIGTIYEDGRLDKAIKITG